MFAIKFRPIYCISDKVILRNLRNRKKNVPGPNPGLDKRIKAFRAEGIKIQDEDAEEFVEKSNSDFYNVGQVYNAHLNETLIGKYELRHHIVKEKYFKENMPNLLTWSEKEQIRHLAATYPDEWTPEKIAESFPVTLEVVKKLLKYAWKPTSEQRIARHDASAMRNWKELKEGTLGISEDLRKKFLKFSDRTIPPLNKQAVKVDITPDEKIGEFEHIIHRCAANENVNYSDENVSRNEETNAASDQRSNTKDTKRMTIDELTTNIKKQLDSGDNIQLPDKIIIDSVKANTADIKTVNNVTNELEIFSESEEKDLTEYNEKDSDTSITPYPERIRIPKKAYKKGATYKLKDCYYDDDGKFLYRVVGMS